MSDVSGSANVEHPSLYDGTFKGFYITQLQAIPLIAFKVLLLQRKPFPI